MGANPKDHTADKITCDRIRDTGFIPFAPKIDWYLTLLRKCNHNEVDIERKRFKNGLLGWHRGLDKSGSFWNRKRLLETRFWSIFCGWLMSCCCCGGYGFQMRRGWCRRYRDWKLRMRGFLGCRYDLISISGCLSKSWIHLLMMMGVSPLQLMPLTPFLFDFVRGRERERVVRGECGCEARYYHCTCVDYVYEGWWSVLSYF